MKGSVLGILTMIAIIAGASHAFHDHKRQREIAAELENGDQDSESDDPTKDKATELETAPPELALAKAEIEKGELSSAQQKLQQVARRVKSSALKREVKLTQDKVRLYRELTEIVAPHQFADGKDLYQIVLPNGEAVLARIRGDLEVERLKVAVRDGRRLELKKSRLKAMARLSETAFKKFLNDELTFRKNKLGADPRPVGLFRTVIAFCLEFGLKAQAFKHLKTALTNPSGGVLIDLFCEGDLASLHRAHADLAGMSEIAMFEEPDLAAELNEADKNRPAAVDSKDTPAEKAEKTARKAARKKANPVLSDSKWKQVDKYYREGLKVYRRSFGASSATEQQVISQAKEIFQKAQQLIYDLDEKYPDDQTIIRRAQDIQQLIYDCLKRQKL